MNRFADVIATVTIVLVVTHPGPAVGQTRAAAAATGPATRPTAWDDIDRRLVFFTVQLASVETSIDAVDKQLKQAGNRSTVRQGDAARARRGNELMDRNAGGPVRWQDFYGRTAETFFYNPAPRPGELRITASVLRTRDPNARVPAPADQRPPQFDYIYRANNSARAAAEADVAKLAGRLDDLLARRRQLEAEQNGLWCKIAFRAVAGRELQGKPLYRFDVKPADAAATPSPAATQRLATLRAAMDFLRVNNRLVALAERGVDADLATFVAAFDERVAASREAFDGVLIRQATLASTAGDPATTIGKFAAVAKRMQDIARNAADAHKLSLDGDRAGDEQRKQTFRMQLQDSLMAYAEGVLAADECAAALAREWKIEPDFEKPAVMPEVSMPTAPAAPAAAATRAPEARNDIPADPAKPKGADAIAPAGDADISVRLNDLDQWVVDNGKWTTTRDGRIRGEGDCKLDLSFDLPPEFTLSFRMNVIDGMRPRVTFVGPGFYLGNEGYSHELSLHNVAEREGEGVKYENGDVLPVTITVAGATCVANVGGKEIRGRLKKSAEKIRLRLSGGDGWSRGTTEFWDFRLTPADADSGTGGGKAAGEDKDARAALDEVRVAYPTAVPRDAKLQLVRQVDGTDFNRNGGAVKAVTGAHAKRVPIGANGQIWLWGVYEELPAGEYLIVYRLQSTRTLSGDGVCFVDVCTNGNTIASRRPAGSELKPGRWTSVPATLKLENPATVEYRLWTHNNEMALDRVYVFAAAPGR